MFFLMHNVQKSGLSNIKRYRLLAHGAAYT